MTVINPVYTAEQCVFAPGAATFVVATWNDEYGLTISRLVHLFDGCDHAERARRTAEQYNAEPRDPTTLSAI